MSIRSSTWKLQPARVTGIQRNRLVGRLEKWEPSLLFCKRVTTFVIPSRASERVTSPKRPKAKRDRATPHRSCSRFENFDWDVRTTPGEHFRLCFRAKSVAGDACHAGCGGTCPRLIGAGNGDFSQLLALV